MNIEQAKEISSSANWAEIVSELNLWIKGEENKLRTCVPEDLGRIQAKINLLETVKNLPQIVIDREE
jgi:hypothetical protein